jgi:hypothetical protein
MGDRVLLWRRSAVGSVLNFSSGFLAYLFYASFLRREKSPLYLSCGGERVFGFKHCHRWKGPQAILWRDIGTETCGKRTARNTSMAQLFDDEKMHWDLGTPGRTGRGAGRE